MGELTFAKRLDNHFLWDKGGPWQRGRRKFPHKSVNLFLILVIEKDELTNLCGNWLLQTTLKILSVSQERRLGLIFRCGLSISPFHMSIPLPSEEGTASTGRKTFTWNPKPNSGSDCLICAQLVREWTGKGGVLEIYYLILESRIPLKTVNSMF